jgi:hypothetical protein
MGYLNDSTMRAHTVSEALAALAASPAAFWVADPSPIGFQMRRLEKGFFAACPAPFDSGAVLYNLRSNSKTGYWIHASLKNVKELTSKQGI